MDPDVIACGVFLFGIDCRFEALVTLTQLPNARFQIHQVSPVLGANKPAGMLDSRLP
jgi:hypothetical protein